MAQGTEEYIDFDEEFKLGELAKKKGKAFKLAGHVFHVRAYAPPAAFLTGVQGLENVMAFFRAVLVPEDRDVFEKIIMDPDTVINFTQVDEIAGRIIGEITGRPTVSPASSGSGDGSTSTGSKENLRSVEPTGSR